MFIFLQANCYLSIQMFHSSLAFNYKLNVLSLILYAKIIGDAQNKFVPKKKYSILVQHELLLEVSIMKLLFYSCENKYRVQL